MSAGSSVNDWLTAVIDSSEELATSMLGMKGAELVSTCDDLPNTDSAAYIALVGEHTAIQVGLGATPENCKILAKSLMGIEPDDDEELDQDEISDAISEIANILAGQVKTRMAEHGDPVNLGLPIFIRGELAIPESTEIKCAEAKLGDIPVTLLVLKSS